MFAQPRSPVPQVMAKPNSKVIVKFLQVNTINDTSNTCNRSSNRDSNNSNGSIGLNNDDNSNSNKVMQKNGYLGDIEVVDDHRAGKVVIDLIGGALCQNY